MYELLKEDYHKGSLFERNRLAHFKFCTSFNCYLRMNSMHLMYCGNHDLTMQLLVGFEDLTMKTMIRTIFWVVTHYSLERAPHFRATYHLQLKGWRISQQQTSRSRWQALILNPESAVSITTQKTRLFNAIIVYKCRSIVKYPAIQHCLATDSIK
jgi:hypothetical protein